MLRMLIIRASACVFIKSNACDLFRVIDKPRHGAGGFDALFCPTVMEWWWGRRMKCEANMNFLMLNCKQMEKTLAEDMKTVNFRREIGTKRWKSTRTLECTRPPNHSSFSIVSIFIRVAMQCLTCIERVRDAQTAFFIMFLENLTFDVTRTKESQFSFHVLRTHTQNTRAALNEQQEKRRKCVEIVVNRDYGRNTADTWVTSTREHNRAHVNGLQLFIVFYFISHPLVHAAMVWCTLSLGLPRKLTFHFSEYKIRMLRLSYYYYHKVDARCKHIFNFCSPRALCVPISALVPACRARPISISSCDPD